MFNGVCGCNACYLLMKSERYNATLFTTICNQIKIKQNSFLLIHPDFTDVEHQFSSLILVSICISYFIVKHHDSGNLYKTGFIWNCGLSTQISNWKWNWIAECHETLKANSSNILLPMRPCLLNLLHIPSAGDYMFKSWAFKLSSHRHSVSACTSLTAADSTLSVNNGYVLCLLKAYILFTPITVVANERMILVLLLLLLVFSSFSCDGILLCRRCCPWLIIFLC